jgi:photosystem II stability/assembly factor-like uncharacterized protein
MKKILLVLLATSFSLATFAQWIEQATGFSAASRGINQIVITDENTAWATAYNGSGSGSANVRDFTRTIDGGNTWTAGTVTGPASTYNWSCLSAIDGNTAWALFYKNTSTATGSIYKTSDGGTSWTQQGTGQVFMTSNVSFPDIIYFWDENTGVTMGDPVNGEFEIYTTADGGTTWTAVDTMNIPDAQTGEYGYVRVLSVVDNILWFGTNQGRIYKSSDYGATWSVVQVTGFTDITEISYRDENNGLAKYTDVNDPGFATTLKRTTDGGATWEDVTPMGTFFHGSMCYVPGTYDVVVSTGVNYTIGDFGSSYSLDGGNTWVTIDSAVQYTTVNFFNPSTGWAGGFNTDASTGGIFKYAGAFIGTNIPISQSNLDFKLYPNPSDGVFYISFEAKNNLPINIQVSDGMGRIVMQKTYKNKNELWLHSLDLRNFSPGVYFLKVENDGTESMKKLVVQ